jgi:hypothetical protein
MKIKDVENSYRIIINNENKTVQSLKKKIFIIAAARLIMVLLAVILCIFTWKNSNLTGIIIFIFFSFFILLFKIHQQLFYKKNYSETLLTLAENENKALTYDFSAFDGGSEYISAEHSFSCDLDLFGDQSLFQALNRTCTSQGTRFLAHQFLSPYSEKKTILENQESIQELASKQKWVNHFRVLGTINKNSNRKEDLFSINFSHTFLLYKNKFWEIVTYLIPGLYLGLLILTAFQLVSVLYFIPLWLITFSINTFAGKHVNQIVNHLNNKTDILTTYISLFKAIEDQNFKSSLLEKYRNTLKKGISSSKAIYKLDRYYVQLNMGMAYPMTLVFNPILCWNIRYAMKIEKWMDMYHDHLPDWFDSLARFDAWCSLSTYAYTHPGYCYPKINTEHFIWEGKELGHPLLERSVCVTNDVKISKEKFFLVITGANMAGKSTYLRSIGVNHVLACIGAPVYAQSLEIFPGNLVTNLRTADSLINHESYFFSELKRLKMIIDRLHSGEHLFIILDEILKGTNSEDKQKGSLALMKQLISLNGNGIIATHDLVLGILETAYPNNIKNYRFEAEIFENELFFDYKLKEGVAQNMNATFLMKKMGITGIG